MKKSEIEIGGTYTAKVSGNIVPVKVIEQRTRYDFSGRACIGWRCRNTATGREIVVKSAQRFRRKIV